MKERAEIAKNYIENKYNQRRCETDQAKDAWEKLEQKMSVLNLNEREKDLIKKDI